jgi:hypothetical protein
MTSKLGHNIGVVIPTCGMRPELWETIDSVLQAKSKSGLEEIIICVNAGAKSSEVASAISNRVGSAVRIVIVSETVQLPMFENWNFCISQVKSPYVHLLHDDDKVSPYFYDGIGGLIEEHPQGVLYSSATMAFGEGYEYHSGFSCNGVWTDATAYLKKRNAFFCPSVIICRAAFSGFETRWNAVGDWKAWHDLACKGPVVCSLEPLAYYRMHQKNATTALERSGENVREVRELLELLQVNSIEKNYRFAADIGYGAAVRAAAKGDWHTSILQLVLAGNVYWSFKTVARCGWLLLKCGVRKANWP